MIASTSSGRSTWTADAIPAVLPVLVLWFAGLCAAAQFAKVALVIPELARLHPEAGAALGFLVSSISAIGALLGLVAGVLASRLGLRRLLLGGLWLGALTSLAQTTGLPLPLLLASRVVEGASHLAIVVTAPTLIAAIAAARWRATAMTLWGTFFGVAFALTAWLGLPLVEARGVSALFLAHALCTAGAALLARLLVQADDAPSDDPDPHRASGAPAFGLRTLAAHHLAAWRSPFVAAPAAGWLFYTLTFVALLAVLPGTMAPEARASTAAALPLASIASSMTLGVALLRRLPAVHVLTIGFVAAALSALALPLVPGEPLPCLVLFAALGLVQGASFAAVPELNPARDDQALANGALAQAGNVGNLCGTPLLLGLLAIGGLTVAIASVIGCYVAAVVAHGVLAHRRSRAADAA